LLEQVFDAESRDEISASQGEQPKGHQNDGKANCLVRHRLERHGDPNHPDKEAQCSVNEIRIAFQRLNLRASPTGSVEPACWRGNAYLDLAMVCGQPGALTFTFANQRVRGCDLSSMVQTCAARIGPVSTARTGTPARTSMSMAAMVPPSCEQACHGVLVGDVHQRTGRAAVLIAAGVTVGFWGRAGR